MIHDLYLSLAIGIWPRRRDFFFFDRSNSGQTVELKKIMWDKLRANRAFLFCLGLGAIVLFAKWLFTGSVFFALADMQREPTEGQTSAGVTTTALMPMLVDTGLTLCITLGLWLLNIGEWVATKIYDAIHDPPSVASLAATPSDSQASATEPTDMKSLVIALGDAAAMNDAESLEKLRVRIRKPYALVELQQAYEKNDLDAVGELVTELNKMHAAAPAAKAKKGGQQ